MVLEKLFAGYKYKIYTCKEHKLSPDLGLMLWTAIQGSLIKFEDVNEKPGKFAT